MIDAIFFVTIYPNRGWSGYTGSDLDKVAAQLDALSNPLGSSRKVMVRFAPEMNGKTNKFYNVILK